MTKRISKDQTGLDQVTTVDIDGAATDLKDVFELLQGLSPLGRIKALRVHPELHQIADELEGLLDGPRRHASDRLLARIEQAERKADRLKAAPRLLRDDKKMAAVRKPRKGRMPKLEAHIESMIGESRDVIFNELPDGDDGGDLFRCGDEVHEFVKEAKRVIKRDAFNKRIAVMRKAKKEAEKGR